MTGSRPFTSLPAGGTLFSACADRSPIFPVFRRFSVADQAAITLRDAIRRGVWSNSLPGEYELASRFGISRPTVHAALTRLADDGLVTISKGRRPRLRSHNRHARGYPPIICVVVPASRETIGYSEHPVLMAMRAELAMQGFGWEEIFDASLIRAPERRLRSLVASRHRVCWLLMASSAAIQNWFQSARVPTFVLGSCYPGVDLPSLDTNYRAVGWHAAGSFVKRGHRRLALVNPAVPKPGDVACREGAASYLRSLEDPVSLFDVTAGPSERELHYKLDRLFSRRSAPTGILVARPAHALGVLVHILRRGLTIPGDVSLISRDNHYLVDLGLPEITRYRSGPAKQARRAVRIVKSLLAGNLIPPKPNLIMPTFVPGATLGPAPREPRSG